MVDMYIDNSEPTENVGQIQFSLEYDFQNTTLILKVIQVGCRNVKKSRRKLTQNFPGQRGTRYGYWRYLRSILSRYPPTR